jgi:DNA (cytosine-5)-methyltransferase 1
MSRQLKAVDFFCGAGGVTRGFIDAGINVLGGIDIDIACKDTYEKNNSGSVFLNKDISKYSPEELQHDLNINPGQDDLIFVGCSPCQYYTTVNTTKDKSVETRLLLVDFQRFVDYFKPAYIFIENVPGLERKQDSPLAEFKEFLKSNVYKFHDGVINAKYFGVPQNRRRYILIASRIKDKINFPKEDKRSLKTVSDAISDETVFPVIPAGYKDHTDFIHTASGLEEINLKRLENTSKNGGSRKDWADNPELQLECYKKHDGHSDGYGRMAWNKVSPTITTKFHSVSNGRYAHPEQDRAISLREGATLQSFPLNYEFHARSQGTIARMIGNAVPPLLAKKIAESILIISQ